MFWVLAIFAGCFTVIIALTLPETYAPVILKHKAQRKRKETGDDRWYAPLEAKKEPMGRKIVNILTKPFKMLAFEPMLQAVTIYMSVSTGFLTAFCQVTMPSDFIPNLVCLRLPRKPSVLYAYETITNARFCSMSYSKVIRWSLALGLRVEVSVRLV